MKSLNSFFAALFTLILIVSCSDSSTGPEFQQRRFGNFVQVSKNTLQWVGLHHMSKQITISTLPQSPGDTTFFAGPNGNDLKIFHGNDIFTVQYIDSSYSFAVFDTTAASTNVDFYNPFSPDSKGGVLGASDAVMTTSITISTFNCDSTYNLQDGDDFTFDILSDSDGVYQTIIVDTDGVEQAMRSIGCQQYH